MPENTEQLKKARSYALLLLKYRFRSVAEFREKLNKRGFSEGVISELAADFRKRGLLDDAKFAKMWLESRMSLRPMGKIRLIQELKAKGVSDFDIEDAIDNAKGLINENETAKALVAKRLRHLSGLDKITIRRRLAGFLGRRGFSYEAVAKALREY